MRLVKVVSHGDLPAGAEVYASTAAEALEGWSRQLDAPIKHVVQVVGFDTKEELEAEIEVDEIHVLPSLHGGKGSFGQFVMAGLMVAVSFIPGIGPAAATALRIAAGVAAFNGIISVFMKAPTLSQENDPESSKYIGSGLNTTKIGTTIGMGAGRYRVGGHFLSLSVDAQEMVYGKFPATPT